MKDVAVVAYCRTGIARATRGALNQTHGIPMTAHVLRRAPLRRLFRCEHAMDDRRYRGAEEEIEIEAAEEPSEVDVVWAVSQPTESIRERADDARCSEEAVHEQHRSPAAVHP